MSIIAAGTTSNTALVNTGNTDGTLQLQVNGTTPSVTLATTGAVGVGSTPGYGTNGQVLTSSGSSAAPTWTTAGASLTTPSFTTTIGVGAATASASGAGITFPATQSASSDANTLDDYEEGTWTPTLTASTTAPSSVSYADQTARYTKVGRVVTVMMFLQINNRTGGSGNTRIEGLPFTSQNVGTAVLGSIYLGQVSWGASRTALYCSVGQNSTYINIGALGTNLDPTGIAITEFNDTNDYVGISITYFV